ncbi:hypothetical protein HHL11_13395 [Ramlibacter sp. G-1-2-2]|uniref:Glycine zipper 2TM domain-containing protein n=1 Tax=Ramlibacter agri TaxID=2728837 RepID=A0A848H2F2_9BURK|nr:hypothetical protein [Ramlibacter agri]NML44754.1 hypothetical protein [Ramlibacter agri]
MKQSILLAALGAVAFGASAQEVGHVISRTPITQQVAVPRQVCNNQIVQRPTTGGGSVLGGLTGAAVGSGIGHGGGQAAAIVVGTVLGAVVGNSVEAQGNTQVVPSCVTENAYENRTVGWNVVYEYRGQQYSAQLPYDPGPTVRLNVGSQQAAQATGEPGPVVTAPPVQQAQAEPQAYQAQPQVYQGQPQVVYQGQPQVVQQAPVYVQQQPQVVYAAPAYPYAYPYPYYRPAPVWPVGLSFNFGYGYWGHRH